MSTKNMSESDMNLNGLLVTSQIDWGGWAGVGQEGN